jgi:anti-sigma-K factor RskA
MREHGPDHERWADAVGAYLLEALPDDERNGFEAHLAACAACRRDVDELQVAADALPMSVEPMAPSPALKERIMDVVRAEAAPEPARRARRRRWRVPGGLLLRPGVALACALALVALGGVAGALLSGGDENVRSTDALVDARQAPGARVQLEEGDGQSRLVAEHFPAPPRGRVYQVWLKRPGDDPQPTNVLWAPSRDGTAEVAVPGSLDGVEAVLVTDEPDGGSARPSRQPVITAKPA